ncbi:hypothetical protein OE88DRAFT_1652714 [Heliocybe sulcata]|uniref:Uncharacterized protein n=1 Tax=Heliocybe sulcata TaxID=5364 RepID=A0A5C3NGQ1_9AGAM|nr:hypothetical protein OE88DRAFT_1652714 [Heliocybe sulcata]
MPPNSSEDSQPNEVRLAGKGAGVPLIRSTNVCSRGRGQGRGRGWGRPSNTHKSFRRHSSLVYGGHPVQGLTGESSRIVNDSPGCAYISQRPAVPAADHSRPRKRRKIEVEYDVQHWTGPQASVCSSSSMSHGTKTDKASKEYVNFLVHLPYSCRKGAPNCNKFRQDWINKNKKILQKQHGLRFIQYLVRDDSISFTFLKYPSEHPGACTVDIGTEVQLESQGPESHGTPSEDAREGTAYSAAVDVEDAGPSGELPLSEHMSPTLEPVSSPDIVLIDLTRDTDDLEEGAIEDRHPDDINLGTQEGARYHGCGIATATLLLSTSKWTSKKLRIHRLPDSASSCIAPSSDAPLSHARQFQRSLVLPDTSGSRASLASAPNYLADPYTRGREREGIRFFLPKHQRDKPRRLMFPLCTSTRQEVFYAVTMHGFLYAMETFHSTAPICLRASESPCQEFVDDACLLNIAGCRLIMLAHAREKKQISLFDTSQGKAHNAVTIDKPSRLDTKTGSGASAVCPLHQPGAFAIGGYDHSIHLWFLRDATSLTYAKPSLVSINQTSMIQSLLAIHDTSHKLISASADRSVHLWDMSSERVVRSLKLSNSVYHVHELENPFCNLLEVGHREQQFEIQDHRLVPEKPVQRFGYPSTHTNGRYIKGATARFRSLDLLHKV